MRCKALSFDDKAVEGFRYDLNGTKVLCFDDQYPKRHTLEEIWSLLDYTHDDFLPDLPRLAASVEAGCYFCGFLRTEIRENLRERTEWSGCEVNISLLYAWHLVEWLAVQRDRPANDDFVEEPLQYRLAALVAHLEVLSHDSISEDCKVFFIAEAPPSKLPNPCLC
jgi:hypothetical protein